MSGEIPRNAASLLAAPTGTSAELSDLLQLRFAARGLQFPGGKRLLTSLAGGHASAMRGRGVDFEELRHYQPGDDVRSMDWKVTARSNSPHVKVYREERERPVFIVVDQSASMRFGSRSSYKSVTALHAAALLAWTVSLRGDRVGGGGFGGEKEFFTEPAAGRRGVLRLLKQLVQNQQSKPERGNGSLASALKHVQRVAKPGSMLIIVSDFADEGAMNAGVIDSLRQIRRHVDVLTGWVSDGLERNLPPPGHYAYLGGNGEIRKIDLEHAVPRSEFQRAINQHRNELYGHCRKLGIHLFGINNDEPLLPALRAGLMGQNSVQAVASTAEPETLAR